MAEPRAIGYFDTSVVQEEFRQKFGGCVVQLVSPKIALEHWVIETNGDGSNCTFINASGENFAVTGGMCPDNIEIVVKFPELGWYILDDTPFLAERVPARQFRRAPNEQNMSFRYMTRGRAIKNFGHSLRNYNATISGVNECAWAKVIGRKYLQIYMSENWDMLFKFDAPVAMYHKPTGIYYTFNSWHRLPSHLFPKTTYNRKFNLTFK